MKISISTFLYFNHSLEDAVKRISDCGYQGIEIWGGRPHAYRNDLSDNEISDIRRKIERSGLEISAFIPAQFRYPTSICSPNERVRNDSVNYLKESIATSLKFGCRKVSICPGHTLSDQGYEDGMKQLSLSIREIHKYAEERSVTLLIEPAHLFESDLILTVKQGVEFIRELGLNETGIALDTGHCNVNKESLADSLSLLKNIPYHIHIDDNNGASDDHKIPGEGNIDFIPFLRELDRTGYDGFLTVELGWGYTQDPDRAAYDSRIRIEKLLKTLK